MQGKIRIAKVVQKRSIHLRGHDFEYWQSQTPASRIEALEQIRQEYHQWRYGAEPRLQRVYQVIKRA